MGGLGKGADINAELARVVGDTGAPRGYCSFFSKLTLNAGTVQQRSTQVRGPSTSLGTCTACHQAVTGESIQVP